MDVVKNLRSTTKVGKCEKLMQSEQCPTCHQEYPLWRCKTHNKSGHTIESFKEHMRLDH